MRPIEIILSAALFLCVLVLMVPSREDQWWARSLPFIVLALAAVQLVVEAYRWQMLPEYVLVLLLSIFALAQFLRPVRLPLAAGMAAMGFLCAGIFLSTALPIFKFPALAGPNMVGTQVRHLIDHERCCPFAINQSDPRELMIQIWYPAQGSTPGTVAPYRDKRGTNFRNSRQALAKSRSIQDAPLLRTPNLFPILLYEPSWSGGRWENTFQAEELASNGYVVIGIDHPGISRTTVFPDGRTIHSRATVSEDYSSDEALDAFVRVANEHVKIRVQDVQFALNTLQVWNEEDPYGALTGKLDFSRIGIFGFSIGGATAAEICLLDERFKAGIDLDGMLVGQSITLGTRTPFLFLMQEDGWTKKGHLSRVKLTRNRQLQFNNEQYLSMRRSLTEFGGYWMTVPETRHRDFSDSPLYATMQRSCSSRAREPEKTARLIARYMRAFFEETLEGNPQDIFRGPARSTTHSPKEAFKPQFPNAAMTG